jgi:hypothetical protein
MESTFPTSLADETCNSIYVRSGDNKGQQKQQRQ